MSDTALVTGGSSGIGLELVRQLAQAGTRVLCCGTRDAPPDALRQESAVAYRACDLATAAGREALIAWVRSEAPKLDWLFNNAGIQYECEIGPELSAESVEREIGVNLTAPILIAAGLVPQLEAAGGCVVNVSSGLAIAPKASSPVYCATKAGLSSFSRTLRYQLESRGVRVVDVITPLVRTPMTAGRHEGAIDPDVFCRQMLAALRSGRDEIYVGKARLLAAVNRIAPGQARRIMRNA